MSELISRQKLIEKDYVLYLIDYFGRMQTWKQEDVLSEIARKVKEAKPVYQPQTVGIDKQKLIEELENRFLVDDNMTWNEAMCFVIDAIKSQPPADQWIPCSERLPEPVPLGELGDDVKPVLVTYLGYVDGEPMCDGTAVYGEDGIWRWWIDNVEVFAMEDSKVEITAWMPLPEPYKGE